MSFSIPGPAAPPIRRQRAEPRQRGPPVDTETAHRVQVEELQQIVSKQAKRIEELKLNTAVQLEHHSTLRRLELERRKTAAQEQISNITPRLEVVRSQWNYAKQQNQGYEMQWGSMRAQFQQVRQRVDALKDQIADGHKNIEETRKTLTDMREHLHRLDRDKAALRAKIKRSLECLVIDDNFLKTRVQEEEDYHLRMQQALAAMEAEYQESQSQYQHEFAPLEEDVKVLAQYLEEMQSRTKELQRYCLELESKESTIEDHWIESVHSVFEGLERSNHLDKLKNCILKFLEQQVQDHKEAGIQPRGRGGNMDAYWLTNAIAVWEAIVREVSQEKQKLQIRDENAQLVAETTQRCQQAKAQLATVKSKVHGTGNQRKQLFLDISDLHYLLLEKKESEEEMIKYVQEIATQLDEDLSSVLHLVRKDGFDDYVSSTDDEKDKVDQESGDFAPLPEEGNEDVSLLVSSIDLDPDDPGSSEALKRMAHRPEGPIREFAARRTQYLQKVASKGQKGAVHRQAHQPLATLERALLDVQVKVTNEVIAFVKNRQLSIMQGLLDPKTERLVADPKYIARARELSNRIERWCAAQADISAISLPRTEMGLDASGRSGPPKIVVEGVRIPQDIARANPIAQASWYVTTTVRGSNFMMYMRSSMAAQLRHVFLSRDLSRLVARRVGSNNTDDDTVLRLVDISNVRLGHKTDVFKDLKAVSRTLLREELALSVISQLGSSFDLECENVDDRNFWAGIFAWVANESRQGGTLHTLLKSGKISVVDTMNHTPTSVEPSDRQYLQVRLAA